MRSKLVQRLLRVLTVLLGAGIGAALGAAVVRLDMMASPVQVFAPATAAAVVIGAALVFGFIFFLLRSAVAGGMMRLCAKIEGRFEKMPMNRLVSCFTGLIAGLLVAALLSQAMRFVGTGIAAAVAAAILFLVCGAVGWSIGWKRSKDFQRFIGGVTNGRMTRHERKLQKQRLRQEGGGRKLLDTSVLIDGRLTDVCRTGFVEGTLTVPAFVLDELRSVADSSDPLRRARGRRGLDNLEKLKAEPRVTLVTDPSDWNDTDDADVKLLRLAQKYGAAIMTGDYNLNRIASVASVKVLNLNELAVALKPSVLPGERLTVTIAKEGRERGQGVGYLDDGTMIVVEEGKAHIGETLGVTVTSALQTNAGRMIFSRIGE